MFDHRAKSHGGTRAREVSSVQEARGAGAVGAAGPKPASASPRAAAACCRACLRACAGGRSPQTAVAGAWLAHTTWLQGREVHRRPAGGWQHAGEEGVLPQRPSAASCRRRCHHNQTCVAPCELLSLFRLVQQCYREAQRRGWSGSACRRHASRHRHRHRPPRPTDQRLLFCCL